MDELINQIMDIEHEAQNIIEGAREAREALSGRIERDSIKMRNDIEAQARRKNESIKQIESDETQKKLGEINTETESALNALNEKYSTNKDKWVDAIVQGVIGG